MTKDYAVDFAEIGVVQGFLSFLLIPIIPTNPKLKSNSRVEPEWSFETQARYASLIQNIALSYSLMRGLGLLANLGSSSLLISENSDLEYLVS